MARPKINTDQETLDMSLLSGTDVAVVVDERKNKEVRKANLDADTFVQKEIGKWIDDFRSADDTEQVAIIAQIHGRANGYRRICGQLLDTIEKDIFSGRKSGYSSLNSWIKENFPFTQMSKSEAYRCLSAYRAVGEDLLEDIGISKASEIAQVKDESIREKLIAMAQENPKITIAEIVEKKEEFQKTSDRPKERIKEKIEERADEIKLDVRLNGPRQIIIEVRSQKERDILNDIIQMEVDRYKRKMAEQLIAEKYPSQK